MATEWHKPFVIAGFQLFRQLFANDFVSHFPSVFDAWLGVLERYHGHCPSETLGPGVLTCPTRLLKDFFSFLQTCVTSTFSKLRWCEESQEAAGPLTLPLEQWSKPKKLSFYAGRYMVRVLKPSCGHRSPVLSPGFHIPKSNSIVYKQKKWKHIWFICFPLFCFQWVPLELPFSTHQPAAEGPQASSKALLSRWFGRGSSPSLAFGARGEGQWSYAIAMAHAGVPWPSMTP